MMVRGLVAASWYRMNVEIKNLRSDEVKLSNPRFLPSFSHRSSYQIALPINMTAQL
jgi:hypothetical protein